MTGNFTLNDKFGAKHDLKRLEVHEGSETLGVLIAINGI